MRKYLDIPLTVVVTTALTVMMLWPLEAPEGSDKLAPFITFAALAFPLTRTGQFELIPILIGASAFSCIIERIQPNLNRSAELNE